MVDAGILEVLILVPLQSAAHLLESKLIHQMALSRLFGNESIYSNVDEMHVDFGKSIRNVYVH